MGGEFDDLIPAQPAAVAPPVPAPPQALPQIQPVQATPTSQGYVYPADGPNAGQPIPQVQVQGYGGLKIDSSKPYGSVDNPMVDAPGRVGPGPSDYHVTTAGDFEGPTDFGEFHDLVPQRTDESLGFIKGLAKPLDNAASGAQWGLQHLGIDVPGILHSAGLTTPEEDAQAHNNMYAQYAGRGVNAGKLGEFAGNMAGTLPLMEAGPLAGGALGAMALSNAKDPAHLALDAGFGAVGGKVGDVVGRGLVDTVAPVISSGVQTLLDAGVPLTTGMIAGGKGVLGRIEQLAQNIPLAGELVRKRGNEALKGFVQATANKALEPLGVTVSGETGQDIYTAAKGAMDDAYDKVGSYGPAKFDPQFGSDMSSIRQNVASLPQDLQNRFDFVMDRELKSRADPAVGGFSAQSAKDIKSQLNAEMPDPSNTDVFQRAYGQSISDTKRAVLEMFGRSSPEARTQLAKADAAYPAFKDFEGAVANANKNSTTPNGWFTPQQLASAGNVGETNAAIAGNATPFGEWSSDARDILPRKFKDVVSPMQSAIEGLVGAGVAGTDVFGGHGAGAALAVPIATASPFYSKPVQDVLRAGLQRTAAARQSAETLLGPIDRMASVPTSLLGEYAATRLSGLLGGQPTTPPR